MNAAAKQTSRVLIAAGALALTAAPTIQALAAPTQLQVMNPIDASVICYHRGWAGHFSTPLISSGDRIRLPFIALDRRSKCYLRLTFRYRDNNRVPAHRRNANAFWTLWNNTGRLEIRPGGGRVLNMFHTRMRQGITFRKTAADLFDLRIPMSYFFPVQASASMKFLAWDRTGGQSYLHHGGRTNLTMQMPPGAQVRHQVNNHRIMEADGAQLKCGVRTWNWRANRQNRNRMTVRRPGVNLNTCVVRVWLRHKPNVRQGVSTPNLLKYCFNHLPERASARYQIRRGRALVYHGNRDGNTLVMQGNRVLVSVPYSYAFENNPNRAILNVQAGCAPRGNRMKRLLSEKITLVINR